MKPVFAVVGVLLLHGSLATLLIKGPTGPILEGEQITLECLYSDAEFNISQVHIEMFSKYTKQWRPFSQRFWCRGYGTEVRMTPDRLLMSVPYASTLYDGSYRCVSDGKNATTPDSCSQVLTIKVHYMGQLSMTREGYSRYLGLSEELKVRSGDDVVLKCSTSASETSIYTWSKNGSDWILPSSQLALMKVSSADGGRYTCTAQHPSVEALRKSRSISISVLPGETALLQVLFSRFCSAGSLLQVLFCRFCSPGSVLQVLFSRFSSPGSLLQVLFCRFSSPGSLLQVLFSRFSSPGSLLQVLFSRFCSAGSVLQVLFFRFCSPGSVLQVLFIIIFISNLLVVQVLQSPCDACLLMWSTGDAPWYHTSNGQVLLVTSVAAAFLLVFVVSVSVFLCSRAKGIKTAKGPIDDHSQKKPIYRTSAESLLSTTADKQPLV
ncbi:uncharacterized protein si:ch211-79k12.1 isoform X2 [Takifugu flavidus]|uniref:uncharacterized protein si:ch211-79k12.1 isoform X2 n=1 Tax=Takifugu flavidus TaxID=433684 RepID=UPI002544B46A|nr:uncharacterized protein si:ch211-79k12.1 isoform X2 [Takifugu flavidus]